MLKKTRMIILRIVRYADSKVIVDAYTETDGRVSFAVVLSSKGKMKRQLFQPLMLLEADCDIKTNAQLHRLREVRMLSPMVSLHSDMSKMGIVMFLSETLSRILPPLNPLPGLFYYIYNGIEWLEKASAGYANFHLVFLVHLTRFLGIFPDLSSYSNGALFDMRNSCFVSSSPAHGDILSPAEAHVMLSLMRCGYHSMHLITMSAIQRQAVLEHIIRYYSLHIVDLTNLKTLTVLHHLYR
ncbi:MAG: DNA repair protein RecO C-terminal domain-containing protein [Prevotella sp.]|nr:DNA repair protein RecO C-terminal domain-containing protein [Prevotella sp.]